MFVAFSLLLPVPCWSPFFLLLRTLSASFLRFLSDSLPLTLAVVLSLSLSLSPPPPLVSFSDLGNSATGLPLRFGSHSFVVFFSTVPASFSMSQRGRGGGGGGASVLSYSTFRGVCPLFVSFSLRFYEPEKGRGGGVSTPMFVLFHPPECLPSFLLCLAVFLLPFGLRVAFVCSSGVLCLLPCSVISFCCL